ncbi:hypothetical protein B0T09DRAFT_131270 [Sordaria sp. MPI-SDFR-AT-0083]|nr:hypothetical protein B0T09DRAFT_131270 [Sordaria sp. MPI-SDFR-AT-0083]
MTTSTSPKTFHPFPCLPWELRARIWELTISPRTVHIQVKTPQRERRPSQLPNRAGILQINIHLHYTFHSNSSAPCLPGSPPSPNLPFTLKNDGREVGGYYEKVSAADLISAAERRSHVWEEKTEAQFFSNPPDQGRYI